MALDVVERDLVADTLLKADDISTPWCLIPPSD